MNRRLRWLIAVLLTASMILPATPAVAAVSKGSYHTVNGYYNWEITGDKDDLTLRLTGGEGSASLLGVPEDSWTNEKAEYSLADMKTIDLSSAANSFVWIYPVVERIEDGVPVYSDTPFKTEIIKLSPSINELWWPYWLLHNLKQVTVEAGNPYYSARDGVLIGPYDYRDADGKAVRNAEKKALLLYPSAKEGSSYSISGDICFIGQSAFTNAKNLKELYIPASVMDMSEGPYDGRVVAFHGCSDLESINVDENNEKYSSESGVLFNKDKKTLLKYPESRDDTDHLYFVPDTVTKITGESFSSVCKITAIVIGKNVTDISDVAFGFKNNFGKYGFHTLSIKDIYYEGSEAEWNAIWEGGEDGYLPTVHYNSKGPDRTEEKKKAEIEKKISANEACNPTDVNIEGGYKVSFNSYVPYFGKKIKKDKFKDLGIKVTVDGQEYTAVNGKIIKLKGAEETVSNASVMITKLEGGTDKKKLKAAQKELKKKTKPKKGELGPVAIRIYAFRLDDKTISNLEGATISGKAPKYAFKFKLDGKKQSFKSGKKDSFGNDVKLEYDKDKKMITIFCNDIQGSASGNGITDKTK